MALNLIAAFAVGFGVAGIIYAIFRTLGRKPPKFLIPAAVGMAILAFSISNEYAWYGRTVDSLPESISVLDEGTYRSYWQPWTYLFPRVNRFVAVDLAELKRRDDKPGYVLAELLLFQRYEPVKFVVQLVDCANRRIADVELADGTETGGLPAHTDWVAVDADNLLFGKVCGS